MMMPVVEASSVSYSTLIKACAGARDSARAKHWIFVMLKAGVEANTISHNTVMKACTAMWPEPSSGFPAC